MKRIPAYASRRCRMSRRTYSIAQVWDPAEPYRWNSDKFLVRYKAVTIYERHIGMAQQREGVGTLPEVWADLVLPRIHADGYNAIQIMAIQEHPYYGSLGYHVSSFCGLSRFGHSGGTGKSL